MEFYHLVLVRNKVVYHSNINLLQAAYLVEWFTASAHYSTLIWVANITKVKICLPNPGMIIT